LVVVVLSGRLRSALTLRLIAVLTGFVMLFSAAFARPGHAGDLWVYAVYGRIVVEHGDNPYAHVPDEYADDPWVQDLVLYKHGRTFYGPLFIGMTAVIAAIGGDSRTVVRLAYQLGAAAALVAVLVLLRRLGAPLHALAFVALNPVLLVEVVSQGRMDLYVGLGLLGGVTLARSRPHLAAVAIAAAALVKIPAALAFPGLVCWVWRRTNTRAAVTVAATAAATMGAAYLAAGGPVAVRALLAASDQHNDLSVWVLLRNVPEGIQRAFGDQTADIGSLGPIPLLASLATVALAGVFVLAYIDERPPVLVVAMPVVAYLLLSPYPTSWYIAWVLPVLALKLRSSAAWACVSLYSLLMVLASYTTAVGFREGARSLADFAQAFDDVGLDALRTALTCIEVLGLVVVVGAAVTTIVTGRHTIFRRRAPSGADRPLGLDAP
jgi:hypothetical protein